MTRKPTQKSGKTPKSAPKKQPAESWDYQTEATLVCKYFCEGIPPAAIPAALQRDYGIEIKREAPYKYLTHAAANKRLRYVAPANELMAERLRTHCPFLRQADVVDCVDADAVMQRAAEVVLDLIQQRAGKGKSTVRIGFAGGRSMALLAEKLNSLLDHTLTGLPQKLICHNLVAGFDLTDPRTNPISFLSPLMDTKPGGMEVQCMIFQAPAIVPLEVPDAIGVHQLRGHVDQRTALLQLPGNKEAVEGIGKCDIIVTSCGPIDDPHQMLLKYYGALSETIKFLRERKCAGDMLWLPICEDGPLRFDRLTDKEREHLGFRTMSLIELYDLPQMIQDGTDVVLAVGPCLHCRKDKGDIVRVILAQRLPLVTHVAGDVQTIRYVVMPPEKPAG